VYHRVLYIVVSEHLAGWLAIPARNKGKFTWKKQYIVVSSKKILFYETDHENAIPTLVIDIELVIQYSLIDFLV